MEPPGDVIGIFVEFAAGIEPGHDQLQGADTLAGVDIHRNTPAVILHPDHIVALKDHQNIITVALHGLVDGVIDHFINQMVKTVDAGGPDIHTGALPHMLKALKDLYIACRIT
jgi:hypothetical protein